MKFRYKVMIMNLMLLSLSLGSIGYLMINKNYNLARDNAIQNAIDENNFIQESVEYEVLQIINSGQSYNLYNSLEKIGQNLTESLMATQSGFYIRYGTTYVFSNTAGSSDISDLLFSSLNTGSKNYVIVKEAGRHYIEITSYSIVDGKELCVISKRDISQIYELLNEQIRYFRIIIIFVLAVDSVMIILISKRLTYPLEKLNSVTDEISNGNYAIRAVVNSEDEIGKLAEKFNEMAEKVELHILELEDMVQRRDRFVADFTHEVKTPMTTIIGYADVMRSMELSREEQLMSLNYIFSEGKRLEAMSGKLFELIYLRRNDIITDVVHTTDIASEVVKIVEPMLKRKNIILNQSIYPCVINGNKELLVTVFVNIIDNARKASEDGQHIEFTGKKKDDQYIFEVKDYGVGMDSKQVKYICDEFYMVDKSRSRKEGGAGLGMALVAMIIERHGAKLDIISQIGKGTIMSISFTNAKAEEEEHEK